MLTIDNTDGALPIDYAEVTISRTMFRNGGSEYAINGEPCRLLDVQELLSDSGIGREMHVIVGQGQLDSVLSATPEDRRGFIEEAAGVLKHRKRKEKALRKLEAMEANLVRLTDLTTELRRQLKPLGRQAEVAKRAGVIQADVRDARLRLLADDLSGYRLALEQEVADENALLKLRAEAEGTLATSQQREIELEAAVAATLPALTDAQETWFRLAGPARPVPRARLARVRAGAVRRRRPDAPRLGARAGGHGAGGAGDPRAGVGARQHGREGPHHAGRCRAAAAGGRARPGGRGGADRRPAAGRSPTDARAWPGSPARWQRPAPPSTAPPPSASGSTRR